MKTILLLCVALATAVPLAHERGLLPEIQTTSGKVIGHKARWPVNSDVDEYLGIPYAKPPVDNERFNAPKPLTGVENVTIKADDFMDACMQPADGLDNLLAQVEPGLLRYGVGMGAIPGRKYSENCLGLNIWSKANSTGPPKAVMIWIYGGGFAAGDTAAPFYNGAKLAAEQDVVVASIGYRLNIFGFPGAPGLSDYNLGLLDQRLAVEWLRDNISKFGGDPKRMTLFGESAGGMSVDSYAYAWTKDPIVSGLISQSGTAFLGKKFPQNNPSWYKISQNAGCGGKEAGQKTVDCMRRLPVHILMKAMGSGVAGIATAMSGFGPTVDDKVVFNNYEARAAAGMFIQIPFLSGTTDNEPGLIAALGLSAVKSAANSNSLPVAVSSTMGYVQAALEGLRSSRPLTAAGGIASPFIDSAFNCPTRDATDARYKLNVPVWRYRFMATFPNTQIYPGTGAYHSIDCPTVFGTTSRNVQNMPNTPEQEVFVSNVMKAWATFAKNPEKGLDTLGWPRYSPQTDSVVRLGFNNQANLTFTGSRPYDATCDTIAQLAQLSRGGYLPRGGYLNQRQNSRT